MKCFFDRNDTKWKYLHGALHVYVVLRENSQVCQNTVKNCEKIADKKFIAMQPCKYLHMTIQRLDLYEQDLSTRQLQLIINKLRNVAESTGAFTVQCKKPAVRDEAVEAVGEENHQWNNLVEKVRNAFSEAGFGVALTDPPFGPHYTVAYCVRDTLPEEDVQLSSTLADFSQNDVSVDSIDLVSVTQNIRAGVFEFKSLAHLELGI